MEPIIHSDWLSNKIFRKVVRLLVHIPQIPAFLRNWEGAEKGERFLLRKVNEGLWKIACDILIQKPIVPLNYQTGKLSVSSPRGTLPPYMLKFIKKHQILKLEMPKMYFCTYVLFFFFKV